MAAIASGFESPRLALTWIDAAATQIASVTRDGRNIADHWETHTPEFEPTGHCHGPDVARHVAGNDVGWSMVVR
jgi:hypothetical protein